MPERLKIHCWPVKSMRIMSIAKFCMLVFVGLMVSSCDDIFNFHKSVKYVVCSANCAEIKAKGTIIDLTKNTGVASIPVTFRWTKPHCWFCPETIIDVKSTNNKGEFSFDNSIDTIYFSKGYFLSFTIPENSSYIISPYTRFISVVKLNDSILDNLKFDFYRKAQLQIQLERVENDPFEVFIVEHSFLKNGSSVDIVNSPIGNNQYSHPLNDTINTETASDMKTYIKWTKTLNSKKIVKTDSIICSKDKISIYKIKY